MGGGALGDDLGGQGSDVRFCEFAKHYRTAVVRLSKACDWADFTVHQRFHETNAIVSLARPQCGQ